MKFRLVDLHTRETLEFVEKKDLFEACAYVNRWYGEDADVDVEFVMEE